MDFVPSVFFVLVAVYSSSWAQLPTSVTRHELLSVGYKQYNPYPNLSADYFLCNRGGKVVACIRNRRPPSETLPTKPQPLLSSASPSKRCRPGKTCLHGTCLGAKCVCQRGWRGKYCGKDLNECSKRTHLCSHRCKNTAGSYTCVCRKGFELMADGHTCSRAQRGHNSTLTSNTSSPRSRPRPRPPQRPAGIRGIPDPRRLTGTRMVWKRQSRRLGQHDEASRNPLFTTLLRDVRHTTTAASAATNRFLAAFGYLPYQSGASLCARAKCQHKCVMASATTATCKCPSGFKLARNRRKCVDINECKLGRHTCKNRNWCHNTIGSFRCECTTGFILINNSDSSTCEDINECLTGQHMCGNSGICHNTLGSYRCHCRKGYQGDGTSCVPIPTKQFSSAIQRPQVHGRPAGLVATTLPNLSRRSEPKRKPKAKRPVHGKSIQKLRRNRYRKMLWRRRYPYAWRRIEAFRRRQRLLSA